MTPTKKFYLIFSIILVLVITIIFSLEIIGYLKISDLQTDITQTEYQTSKVAERSAILSALEKRYDKIEPDIDVINTALPDNKEASRLISDLESLAKQSGLKFTQYQVATITGKTKTAKDPSLIQTIKGKNSYELPLDIEVSGRYTSFVNFIKNIENYQRLMNITALEITKIQGEASDYIEVKIKLTAYLKK